MHIRHATGIFCACLFLLSCALQAWRILPIHPGGFYNTSVSGGDSVDKALRMQSPAPLSERCWLYARSNSDRSLESVSFADSLHGIVGEVSWGVFNILRTADGGATWQRSSIPLAQANGTVQMIDSVVAYAVVGGRGTDGQWVSYFFISEDGGITWTVQNTRMDANISSFAFYDRSRGFTVSWDGLISGTTDGGIHWFTNIITTQLRSVYWLDSLTAIVAGTGIYRTTNGGIFWVNVVQEYFSRVSFFDQRNGIAVQDSDIYRTTDGGVTWHWQTRSPRGYWTGIAMADSNHFVGLPFVRGNNHYTNRLFETTDGGTNWVEYPTEVDLKAVDYPDPSHGFVVGESGCILMQTPGGCKTPVCRVVNPPDGYESLSLFGPGLPPGSCRLSWELEAPLNILYTHTRVQISTDAEFSQVITTDTLLPVSGLMITGLMTGPLSPRFQYFWRIAFRMRDGTYSPWNGPWKFTTAGSSIRGSAFNDLDRNGIRDSGEPVMNNISINVRGKATGAVSTDSTGTFTIPGVDSGRYVIHPVGPIGYRFNGPDSIVVMLGLDESLRLPPFPMFFPWNTISGIVYEDRNENGKRDSGETGVAGFRIRLSGGIADSVLTDSLGMYSLFRVGIGFDTVRLSARDGWEQIAPNEPSHYETYLLQYDQHLTGYDFSVRRTPHDRVRLTLTFTANGSGNTRDLFWGVRRGASDGIWEISPAATVIDYSEGEFELPPINPSFFDVRFYGNAELFGQGSWTDMREYAEETAVDTYRVRFTPGALDGGRYPVTFRWDSALVTRSYSGVVELGELTGQRTDMKSAGLLIVSDSTIGTLWLVAAGPVIGLTDISERPMGIIPRRTSLEQNFPNPFNPSTQIRYQLPMRGHVRLKVYDVIGRELATLVDEFKEAGEYSLNWIADGVPSGVYFYRLTTGRFIETKKMILMK